MSQLPIIEELQSAHDLHIKKLTDLHEKSLADLESQLQRSKQEASDLRNEKDKLLEIVDEMRAEVDELKGSFELVQGRLRRVLVDQDDLVKLIRLLNKEDSNEAVDNANVNVNVNNTNVNNANVNNVNVNNTNAVDKYHSLTDIESHLNSQNQEDVSVKAALLALKYFKKLQSSDPLHLSSLLEIPFCLDRSFALSASLLTSISGHLAVDAGTAKHFNKFPVYPVLLDEIARLRQEINELCRVHLVLNATPKLDRKLADKNYKGTISQCIIGEGISAAAFNEGNSNGMNMTSLFSSMLSNFTNKF